MQVLEIEEWRMPWELGMGKGEFSGTDWDWKHYWTTINMILISFFCAVVSAFSSFLFRVCDSNAVISSGHSVLKLLRDGFA
jgi:hypothetical protein